jgi:hypothetical protein
MYMSTAHRGLGATPQQAVAMGSSLGAPAVIHFAAPAVAHLLGITAASAVPIIGAAIAGITIGIEAILNSGCGQSCIVTSNWANEAEKLLADNIAKYFAIPAPRPRSVQALAVNNGRAIIAYLTQECSQPGLSTAGKNCIEDRQAGACKWRQTADSPLLKYPGEPQPGECWNWVSGYIDPIASDPNAVDDAALALAQAEGSVAGAFSSVFAPSSSGFPLALVAALALIVAGVAYS